MPDNPKSIPIEEATKAEIIAALGKTFLFADQKKNFERELYWIRCDALLSEMSAAMDEAASHQGKDRQKWWAAHLRWTKANDKLRILQGA